MVVEVSEGGRKPKVSRMVHRPTYPEPSAPISKGIVFQGQRFIPEGHAIVNAKTGDRLDVPYDPPPQYEGLYAPAFRVKNATNLGKSMLWCWAWDNMDASLDPSVWFTAYEVGLEKGRLKLLRRIDLPGVVGIGATLNRVVNGIALFSTVESVTAFDTASWQRIGYWQGRPFESGTGRLYLQTPDGSVSQWNVKGRWEQKSGPLAGIDNVWTVGGHDVLLLRNGLHNLATKASYRFPEPLSNYRIPAEVIADPKVGIGVVWQYRTANENEGAGVILDPATLTPRCTIQPKSPKTWRPQF